MHYRNDFITVYTTQTCIESTTNNYRQKRYKMLLYYTVSQ